MRAIPVLLYLALGLFQWFAVVDGIRHWLDIGAFFAIVIAFFVSWMPLVGTISGVLGAHYAWQWSWFSALALFFGPQVVMLIIVFAIAGFEKMRSR